MKCQEVMECMQRYLDRDLGGVEQNAMQEHLRQCPECTEMFERLTKVSNELEQLPKVEPPYSIVDSIMPRLAEIDIQKDAGVVPGPGYEPKKAAAADKQAIHAKRMNRLSMVAAGSVVAAGLLVAIILPNYHSFTGQMANGVTGGPAASTLSAANSSGSNHATTNSGTSTNDSAKQSLANPKSASNSKSSGSSSKVKYDTELQPNTSTSNEGFAAPNAIVQPKSSGGETPDRVQVMSESSQAKANTSTAAPGASQSQSSSSSGSGTASGTGSDSDSATSQQSTMTPSSKVAAAPSVASPDGTYQATIQKGKVVIQNKSGDTVFTSTKEWSAADSVQLLKWISADAFRYEVTKDGSKQDYTIHLKNKSETKTTVPTQ